MTDWVKWSRQYLHTSAEAFEWAFSAIDPAYHQSKPPEARLGLWSPARHVWHVTGYERCIAMPTMRQWLGAPPLPDDDRIWPNGDDDWAAVANQPADIYMQAFWDVRNEQIALLDALAVVDWATTRETAWGDKPLTMVITKTYQHTLEHSDSLLKMGLWWKDAIEWLSRGGDSQ
ncbi:MAG: hypothetical protein LCI00_28065 [Chloroflexi bacterium]|nr:hypothetical protein [Chloroflexota bacterium]MCC6893897.1 hypothetical protein [Anaerolineae bacterium]